MAINFRLVSEFQTIHRRPFELADPASLKPTNVRPIIDGEWLELNGSYKMARGGNNNAGSTSPGTVPAFLYFAERGRYETQAIQKGPFLYGGFYEADTLIMDGAGLTLGGELEVNDVTIASLTKRGLKIQVSGKIVGYVTRLPANNNNFLRFIRTDA